MRTVTPAWNNRCSRARFACPRAHYVDAALTQCGLDLAQQLRIADGHGRNQLLIAGCTAA